LATDKRRQGAARSLAATGFDVRAMTPHPVRLHPVYARPRLLRVHRLRGAGPLQGPRVRRGVTAYTLGPAARLRRRPHLGHRQHHPQGDERAAGHRQAPPVLAFGYFFSLGHSTIVVAIGIGIIIAEKTVFGAVSQQQLRLGAFGGLFGTIVSAAFLFLIGCSTWSSWPGSSRSSGHAARRVRRGGAGAPAGEPRLSSTASSASG
jgi:hypothetical protein